MLLSVTVRLIRIQITFKHDVLYNNLKYILVTYILKYRVLHFASRPLNLRHGPALRECPYLPSEHSALPTQHPMTQQSVLCQVFFVGHSANVCRVPSWALSKTKWTDDGSRWSRQMRTSGLPSAIVGHSADTSEKI